MTQNQRIYSSLKIRQKQGGVFGGWLSLGGLLSDFLFPCEPQPSRSRFASGSQPTFPGTKFDGNVSDIPEEISGKVR